MEKNKGGDPVSHVDRVDEPPTLEEIGISKNLSAEAQALASNYARRLISSAETFDNVKNVPVGTVPVTERQCRPLVSLNAHMQREAWQRAVATAPDGKVITSFLISEWKDQRLSCNHRKDFS